jgi:hypothetical protein
LRWRRKLLRLGEEEPGEIKIQRWAVHKLVPQIANPQTFGLTKFVGFADLPQMWQFVDLRTQCFCDLRIQFFWGGREWVGDFNTSANLQNPFFNLTNLGLNYKKKFRTTLQPNITVALFDLLHSFFYNVFSSSCCKINF